MVECTNFPLDGEDCKKCKEYPCDIIRYRIFKRILEPTDKARKECEKYGIDLDD